MSLEHRVLVVEDETLIAILIEEALAQAGCSVVGPAPRMAKALEMAGHESFDCAVLDVNVHGEPIYPLADLLAAREIPFIFVTGYATSEIAERFRDRPVLRKPFSAGELNQAVGRVCPAHPTPLP